jgi:polysaccharide export outer membrane protein
MKKTLLLFSFCLTLSIIFNAPQMCFGAGKYSDVKNKATVESSRDSYKIGSGDILEIMTWKEPDFSRNEVLVRIDGKMTFPLLDDIQAAGRTPLELKKNIEARLKGFVDNPVVTVTVINPESQKIYILGEIIRTGEYDLKKNLTVLQAFALAGGFTQWASKKEIILLRHEKGKDKIIRVNYKNIIKGSDLMQNMPLQANDTIIVP